MFSSATVMGIAGCVYHLRRNKQNNTLKLYATFTNKA